MDEDERILNCQFTYECPRMWEALEATTDSRIRHCGNCERTVTFITTGEELAIAIQYGACVAANVKSEGLKRQHTGVGVVGEPGTQDPQTYDIYLEQGTALDVECLRAIQELLHTDENLMQLRKRLVQTDPCLLCGDLSPLEAHFFADRARSLGIACTQRPSN